MSKRKKPKIIMVNLDHPCRVIDVWLVDESEVGTAKMQGYIPLEEIRKLVYKKDGTKKTTR